MKITEKPHNIKNIKTSFYDTHEGMVIRQIYKKSTNWLGYLVETEEGNTRLFGWTLSDRKFNGFKIKVGDIICTSPQEIAEANIRCLLNKTNNEDFETGELIGKQINVKFNSDNKNLCSPILGIKIQKIFDEANDLNDSIDSLIDF